MRLRFQQTMTACANCSRSFDGDKSPYCGSLPQLIIHDSPVPDTSPWWARPTDYAGWEIRIWLFGCACVAIVWTAEKLGRALTVVVGVLSLGVLGFVIRLRYRDDDL
jgi:hypothetical protein